MRILLVDDAEAPRRSLAELLRGEGYVVTEAGNGVEAVEAYRRLRPLGVLMDVNMPLLDGFAAARAIRALDADARILLMSGLSTPDRCRLARRAGALALLSKPLAVEPLLGRLGEWAQQAGPEVGEG